MSLPTLLFYLGDRIKLAPLERSQLVYDDLSLSGLDITMNSSPFRWLSFKHSGILRSIDPLFIFVAF